MCQIPRCSESTGRVSRVMLQSAENGKVVNATTAKFMKWYAPTAVADCLQKAEITMNLSMLLSVLTKRTQSVSKRRPNNASWQTSRHVQEFISFLTKIIATVIRAGPSLTNVTGWSSMQDRHTHLNPGTNELRQLRRVQDGKTMNANMMNNFET